VVAKPRTRTRQPCSRIQRKDDADARLSKNRLLTRKSDLSPTRPAICSGILVVANHLTGLAGAGTYDAVMKVFRHVYRTDTLQPLLVALFFFQIGTGLFLVWRHTAAPSDRFRTFQIASGVYLAFYVLGHMDSVFIFARTYLGIDTGWGFATGAPTGLVRDPWNIRLVPHYWLGVFFVLAHLAAGIPAVELRRIQPVPRGTRLCAPLHPSQPRQLDAPLRRGDGAADGEVTDDPVLVDGRVV
jgi:hypothetical protein